MNKKLIKLYEERISTLKSKIKIVKMNIDMNDGFIDNCADNPFGSMVLIQNQQRNNTSLKQYEDELEKIEFELEVEKMKDEN